MSEQEKINIMVCVTRQRSCERLIKRAVSMNEETGGSIGVVHVAGLNENLMGNPDEGAALDILFSVSKYNGAQMHMLRSDDLTETLVEFAKEHDVDILILGESKSTGNKVKSIVSAFNKHLPNVEQHVLS
ncbi:MAG: universal stress protein [Eubacteriales bacterium]